jgi:hypothetical protein
MATEWISPTWRMPQESNQSKVDNYSLSLDGSTEYMTIPSTNFGDASTNVSYSLWLKPNMPGGASNYGYLLSGASSSDGGLAMNEGGSGAGGVNGTFYYYNGSTVSVLTSTPLTAGNWAHLVFIFDASANEVYAYINGSLDKTTSVTAPFKTTFTTLFRYTPATTHYYDGQAAQICIYNYTITSSQVTALYNSGTPVNPMAISGQLPIAYYPLGGGSTGDAADPATTLTVPNDSVPDATVFNFVESSTQYIDIGTNNSVLMPTDEFSISLWVKFSAAAMGNIRGLFSANSAGGNNGYLIWKGGDNKVDFLINETGAPSGWRTAVGPVVAQDTWYHIVCTWDGSTSKIYVDNDTPASTSVSTIVYDASTVNRIGDYATYEMDGDMANVQFWNKGLSAANVTTLYNNGVPLYTGTQPEAANLKGWWKLNVDTSTWNGSDWIIGDSAADYPTCLQFDGSSGVNISQTGFPWTPKFSEASDISISFWMRTDKDIPGSYNRQFAVGCWHSISSTGSSLGTVSHAFTDWTKTIARVGNSYGSTKLNDGNWHHIVYTFQFSDGQAYGYVDGNSTAEVSATLNNGAALFWALYIGGLGFNDTYDFDGQVSNVLYYNKVITGSEATTLYNNGAPQTSPSFSPDGWWKCDNLTTGIQDSAGSNNGTNDGATVSNIPVSPNNGTSNGMTTANLVTSDLTRSIPYSSYSMEFDGTDDKITLSSGVSTGNNYSVSFWLNPDNVAAGNSYIFSDSTGSPYPGLALDQGSSSAGGPGNFYYYNGSVNVVNTTAISLGSWSHIVITLDVTGQEIKFYINGSLDKTTTSIANIGTLIDEFGTRSAGNYFNGKLSNISIFTTPLSQDQILTIYNGGVPNSLPNLSPVGWWSLSGDSYFNGTNWICPDLGSGGNNGTSSGMGGTELVGDGPGSSANGTATSMNIPANLKGDAPNSSKNAFSINMNSADRVADVAPTP